MPTTNYTVNGAPVPSVTTVIDKTLGWNKDALVRWAYKQGKAGRDLYAARDEAGNIGTLAHYLAECHIKGLHPDHAYIESFPEDTKEAGYVAYRNFGKWFKSISFDPLLIEGHLVSEEHGFGGTPDCIAYINGELSIFDLKTSMGIYSDYLIQICGGYSLLWEESHADQLIERYDIVRFGKFARTHTHFSIDAGEITKTAQGVFLNLLQIYRAQEKVNSLL
jgi:hypothetical protein